MARIQHILDEAVSYGFTGGGGYSTNVTDLENRFEERDENWMYAKHRYNASFENIQEDTQEYLIHSFHAARGKKHSFLMRDWNDYKIRDQPIDVLPSTTDKIQLYKLYDLFAPAYTIRPIQAIDWRAEDWTGQPVQPPVIKDDSDNVVAGTFNALTGEFTPDAGWGGGQYTLSCDFLVWVRFDSDDNEMTINGWRDHSADVQLVEDPFEFDSENVPLSWDGNP